jgi:hypothetical protein
VVVVVDALQRRYMVIVVDMEDWMHLYLHLAEDIVD